jgi:TP901 family phage tail tape measure protein
MYLGKMIEVTREAPANLGTAMKTIIARFEDMKKDPMAILEDGVSANKVEAALATIGIALRNSEGEFRALQDVMDELGMKWNSLTRNQQAYIATVAA